MALGPWVQRGQADDYRAAMRDDVGFGQWLRTEVSLSPMASIVARVRDAPAARLQRLRTGRQVYRKAVAHGVKAL